MTEKEDIETKPSTDIDEHGNEIRTYSDAEVGINIGNDFVNPPKDTDKKPDKKSIKVEESPKEQPSDKANEEKTSDKEPPKEQPLKDQEAEPTFEQRVVERLKTFEDEEQRSKFLKDLENYEKFQASNTQERQKIAEEKKNLDVLIKELVGEDYQKTVDEILKLDDLKDFLESADNWYLDREEGNPFRKMVEHWRAKNDNVVKYHKGQSEFESERSELELEKEIFEIQKLDDRYKDTETLVALGDLADKHGVDLKTAHKIWLSDNLSTDISELNDKIKALEKDKTNIKKELKARNEEVTELKSKVLPPLPGITEPAGAESFDYGSPSTGFDETEQRLYKKLGVMP
jgi:hypothetical protein